VIALLMVGATEEGLQVICHRALVEKLVTHLRRFVFRDDVTIEPLMDTTVSSHAGEGGAGHFEPLPGHAYSLSADAPGAGDAAAAEAARAVELTAGIAWLDGATSEQFLPQMLGHEAIGALSFRKGCFPGQEIIARTRYLGKLKRFPWAGTFDAALPLAVMAEGEFRGEGVTGSAVLVDQARGADGATRALFVVRCAGPFDVEEVVVENERFAASGAWLAVTSGT
jgi:folate-binding protein YgfZ